VTSVDAVVVGGGPAGLLARQVLSRHGLKAVCMDPNIHKASPQSAHVHLIPDEALRQIGEWIPGFTEELRREACLPGDARKQATLAGDRKRLLTRDRFDRALARCCAASGSFIAARAKRIRRDQAAWQVASGDGRTVNCRWLIDASGRSRHTLRVIASLSNDVPVLHEGPPAGHYMSATVRGLMTSPGQAVLRCRGDSMNSIHVLGLRLDADRWQVTLQLPAGSPRISWNQAVTELEPRLAALFRAHSICGPIRRYGEQRSSALDINSAATPSGWVVTGDALICTSPYQGNGLANLVEHLRLLDRGLRQQACMNDIRQEIFRHAGKAWLQATLLDSLSSRHFLPELTQRRIALGESQ